VFTALVTACGQAWADFDVYMPRAWAGDPELRKKAGIPEGLAFATKPELAIEQLKRLTASGIRVLWAAADEVYGRCGEFRDALRALSLAYVVIVPCSQVITLAKDKAVRADQAIADAVFETRSCGNGEKGPRYADWALVATADPREFLLVRRLNAREKNQYTFYLCWAPDSRPATMTYFITSQGGGGSKPRSGQGRTPSAGTSPRPATSTRCAGTPPWPRSPSSGPPPSAPHSAAASSSPPPRPRRRPLSLQGMTAP
jgi:DDE superfamily endonuclease